MRLRKAVVMLALVISACTGATDSSSTLTPVSALPTATPTQPVPSPTTTGSIAPAPPTASTVAVAEFASGAGVTLGTSGDCPGLTDPIAAGTITWSDGEQMWEAQLDGEISCLFHVDGSISSLEWGPQGDRLLVNEQLIVGGPVSGQVVPRGIDWSFTYPSGLNLIGLEGGSIIKWNTDGDEEVVLTPITDHTAVAYHPSGLHIAAGGVEQPEDADFDPTAGVFIANSDGTDAVNLILGFDTVIRDIRFANDGSQMYFIAEHDGLIHFHSISTVPDDVDGTKVLGAGAEEFATTHATSSGGGRVEFSRLIVHPTLPGVAAWTTPECEPVGSRGFQVFAGDEASLVQAVGPVSAVGFLNSGASTVIVAGMLGSCDAPRELFLTSASLETSETTSVPVADNVTAAAVRNVAAPHQYDLVDVEIAGFA